MPIKPDREYRAMAPMDVAENEYTVTGTAVVFNSKTVLYEYDGIEYCEIIDRAAFDSCDMTDVIMNYNHSGKVVARLRNQTLILEITETGMNITAYLGGTEEGRKLYEEIKGGYIDRMSFSFTVAIDGDDYDQKTHTRTVNKVKKLYDVAAVDIPAYEQTSILARSFFDAEREKELRFLEQERRRKTLIAKTLL